MSSQPIFSLEDEEDEQVEYALPSDMSSALGNLDDLPPELREALRDPVRPVAQAPRKSLQKRSPLFQSPRPPEPLKAPESGSVPLPRPPQSRDVGYEVKEDRVQPLAADAAGASKPITVLRHAPPLEDARRHNGQQGGSWGDLVNRVGTLSLWGSGSGGGGGQEEEYDEDDDEEEFESYSSEELGPGDGSGDTVTTASSWLGGVFGATTSNTVAATPAFSEASSETEEEVPASWLGSISARVQSVTASAPPRRDEAWCSWCFQIGARQQVERSEHLVRAHLRCQECNRATVSCFGCDEGVARRYGESCDKLCYRCTGLAESVDCQLARLSLRGHKCSWCRATASQALWRTASGLSGGKDLYQCEACGSLTRQCSDCTHFARAAESWRDEKCIVCDGSFRSWPAALETWEGRAAPCSWCLVECK